MIEIEGELDSHWESLEMHPGDAGDWRAHRLAIDGPIACYAAIRNLDGRRGIIFETPIGDAPQGRLRFEAEGISVREQRDFDDGRYRVAANTEQEGYRTIFRVIALDLLAVVDGPMPVTVGWARLQQRIEAWQACLRARRRGLTREEQVGLYGELVCLRVIAATVSMTTALEAWKGPLRGLHDFVLGNRALEVKTASGNDARIRVGSLDQLEERDVPLAILRPRLQPGRNGLSLVDLVDALRAEIAGSSPASSGGFEELLLRAGYLAVDAADYVDRFEVSTFHVYEVDHGFPLIRRSDLDPAVVEAEYQLDEGRLLRFRRDGNRLDELLAQSIRP